MRIFEKKIFAKNIFIKRLIVMAAVFALCVPQLAELGVYAAVETKTDNSTIPGWSVEFSKADGGAFIDTEEKYSGEASMRLENHAPSDNGGYLRVSYPVTVEPNHQYVYGFKAKVKNASGAYAQVNWIRTALGYLNPTGDTADWRNFEFAFSNGEDTTAYLRFILEKGAEYVWIDDVYFYDTSMPQTEEYNLIDNPSFESIASTDDNVSTDIIPVMKKSITVDGDISDWADIEKYHIDIYTDYTQAAKTIDANIAYAWDDDNFYFEIEAEDDVHYPITSGSYWNGDSLQFTICKTTDSFGTSYGVSYDEASGEVFKFGDTAMDVSVVRNGTKTTYEIAIPWDSYFSETPDVALFCAIVNDNDNDGVGRRGCADVAPGISMYKGSQLFPRMIMMQEGEEYAAYMSGASELDVNAEGEFAVTIANRSENSKTFAVKSETAGIDDTVTVEPMSNGIYNFTRIFNEYGTVTTEVSVSDGNKEEALSVTTEVCPDSEMTKTIIEKQKQNLDELTALKEQCEERDIPIEYQKVKYSTIELFIGYLEEDLEDGDLTRIAHQDKVMTQLYNEAKTEFEELLAGTREPVQVPKYITSPVEVEGHHFVADTQTQDGKTERRPVFFVGAGHWEKSRDPEEVRNIASVGFNCMQPEIGPWDAMVEARSVKDWSLKVIGEYDIEDETSSSVARSDGKSLKIVSTMPYVSNNYCYFRQTIDVLPNTEYEYGISAKGTNVNQVYYSVAAIGDKAMRKYLNGTYDWKDESWTMTTAADQTELTFIILVEDTVSELYLDDAFVRKAGTDENLLSNGSFEDTYPEDQYYAMEESVVKDLAETFATCDEENISCNYSAAPHYVPAFFENDHPEAMLPEQYGNFSHQDPRNADLQKMYEIFYKSLIPRIKDYESFDGVVLANEPQFNSSLSSYAFIDEFRSEMQKKYGTIDKLNERWNTSYESFNDVTMPTAVEATPRFYDWRVYNDQILPNWIDYLGKFIKSVKPDVFTSVKVMDTFGRTSNFRVTGSNNYEVLSDYTDINGCDAWSLMDTYDIRWKNVFYDFLSSVKEAPIYNSEDHIIVDAPQLVYRDEEVKYNVVDVWSGAIHGRGGSNLWIWDRSDRTKNGTAYFNSLLTARPDSIATLGKTTLDLNRLAEEVVALQDALSKTAILYSQNSIPYAEEMLDMIFTASAALSESGQKTRFVVESDSDKMFDYDILIVPNSVSVTEETLNNLKKYVDNGGYLLILGDNALTVNEYGDAHNSETVDHIKNNAVCMSYEDAGTTISFNSKAQFNEAIKTAVTEKGLDAITVIDNATGKPMEECEYLTAELDGAYIVSLCNYEWTDKDVSVYINGEKVGECEDLINFGKYADTLKAEAYVPLLLKITK